MNEKSQFQKEQCFKENIYKINDGIKHIIQSEKKIQLSEHWGPFLSIEAFRFLNTCEENLYTTAI